jgi:hypothetical protein
MVKKERRRPPASGESVANALDRWAEDGGAAATLWPLPYETSDLLDVERRVLECLGAALVSEWNGLPTDLQRRLFEHAASGASRDTAQLKSRIPASCTIIKTLPTRAKVVHFPVIPDTRRHLCFAFLFRSKPAATQTARRGYRRQIFRPNHPHRRPAFDLIASN